MPDPQPLRIGEPLRVLIVAGIPVGVLVAGLGSRLAMFVLRLTSDESVIGATSDDDFEIGRVTFGGTINLLVLGSVAGLFGAALYQWVRPWLIGPHWFGLLTVGLAAGAVVGSMLVHADGVDFVVLTPTSLAVTLFVLLPALFGICIGLAVDRVERPTSWTARGRTRWLLPVLLVLPFPPAWFIVAFAAFVLLIWLSVRDLEFVRGLKANTWFALTIRALWLGVAVLGLFALIGDIRDLQAVT